MSVEAQPAERALTRREIPSDDAGAAAWNLMLAGELYVSAQPHLAALRAEAKRLTLHYNGALGNGSDLAARSIHLGETFGAIGANAVVEPPFRVDYGLNVRVGANFYANFDCVFLDCARIDIGDDVLFGPGVHLYTAGHPLDSGDRHDRDLEFAHPVRIGSRVWVGGGAIILPKVTIGDGCVIGAGSVVTKDVPAYSLAVGNPARVIRKLK